MSIEFKSSPVKRHKRTIDTLIKSDPINSKSKIAPRSSLQFKVGPPFGKTIQVSSVHSTATKEALVPHIDARIDRGFDLIDNEWIGYKRNYFSVVASFQFEDFNKLEFQTSGFYTEIKNEIHPVKRFAIRLVSRCLEDNSEVPLVQHTAKRDRGPQIEPPVVTVVPGALPSHFVIKESANIRKQARIMHFDRLFYDENFLPKTEESILNTYPSGNLTKVVKYERIQFASSAQHRKPSTGKKNFILQVELMVELEKDTYAVIALSATPPLTVRGRSPSNYTLSKLSGNQEPRKPRHTHSLPQTSRLPIKKENLEPNSIYSDDIILQQGDPFLEYEEETDSYATTDSRFESPRLIILVPFPSSNVFRFESTPSSSSRFSSKFRLGEPSPEPELLEPHFYLRKSFDIELEKQCSTASTFSSAFTEKSIENGINGYHKTYLDDSAEDQACISPSLLFSIPE